METFLGLDVLTRRPEKPRVRGITIMRDSGMGFRTAQDIVESVGEFVDYVKQRHFFTLRARNDPDDLILRKNRLYRENRIDPFPGGIVFELAHVRGRVAPTFEKLVEMDFTAVEISDNMVEISLGKKVEAIREARRAGLKALFEYGKKYGEDPLEAEAAAAEIGALLEAGAEHVIIERTEIENLLGLAGEKSEAGRLKEVVERVGLENLIFEGETMEHLAWLIQTFGPEVNIGPNLEPERICKIEPLRHGLARESGYTIFEAPAR